MFFKGVVLLQVFGLSAALAAECPNIIVAPDRTYCLPTGMEDSDNLPVSTQATGDGLLLLRSDIKDLPVFPEQEAVDVAVPPDLLP